MYNTETSQVRVCHIGPHGDCSEAVFAETLTKAMIVDLISVFKGIQLREMEAWWGRLKSPIFLFIVEIRKVVSKSHQSKKFFLETYSLEKYQKKLLN